MEGVDRLFLTCANHPMQMAWETAAIDAAAAGVDRVVKQSALGAVVGSPVAFFDANARIEEHLRASGLASVMLRPAFKMSNLFAGADGVRQAGALFLPGPARRSRWSIRGTSPTWPSSRSRPTATRAVRTT